MRTEIKKSKLISPATALSVAILVIDSLKDPGADNEYYQTIKTLNNLREEIKMGTFKNKTANLEAQIAKLKAENSRLQNELKIATEISGADIIDVANATGLSAKAVGVLAQSAYSREELRGMAQEFAEETGAKAAPQKRSFDTSGETNQNKRKHRDTIHF